MRRKDREITDRARIDTIIRHCAVCHLGLVSDGQPYVVPMSFGYDGESVYLHMAPAGRKLDALRTGAQVCMQWDAPGEIIKDSVACGWGTRFASVIAWGTPALVEDAEGQRAALDHLMAHYAGKGAREPWEYAPATLAHTVVVRIMLEEITGKERV